MQGIGGLLVSSRPILEKGGAVVCICTTAVVEVPMAEVGLSEVAPTLQRSVGWTGV